MKIKQLVTLVITTAALTVSFAQSATAQKMKNEKSSTLKRPVTLSDIQSLNEQCQNAQNLGGCATAFNHLGRQVLNISFLPVTPNNVEQFWAVCNKPDYVKDGKLETARCAATITTILQNHIKKIIFTVSAADVGEVQTALFGSDFAGVSTTVTGYFNNPTYSLGRGFANPPTKK